MTTSTDGLVERAKAEAQQLRVEEGIPVRVIRRGERVIWSKVDDQMRDLTVENSEGMLHRVRAVFVSHGEPSVIEAQAARIAELEGALARIASGKGCDPADLIAIRNVARQAMAGRGR